MRPTQIPAGETERSTASYRWWEDAAGLAAPMVALALWVLVVAGVAVPLGAALARLDGAGVPPAPAGVAQREPCPVPPGALASASRGADAARCR